jgi:NitT/TauT family transport system permease protein
MRAFRRLLLMAALLGLWEAAARLLAIPAYILPPPSAVGVGLYRGFRSGIFVENIWITMLETFLGFALGASAGFLLGTAVALSRRFEYYLYPIIIMFQAMPKVALAPLIILVFGMGLPSKVAIATALTLVVSTLTAYSGVQAVDKDQERLFYSLGASRWQVFTKLVAPSCLPWIISILRVNIGLALTGSVVGEFVSSQHGLGRTILYAGSTYEIALVWVAVIVLSVLSMVMYATVSWLEHVLRKGIVR